MYCASKLHIALTAGALLGNYYLHHGQKFKIQLGLENMPETPSIRSDPPGFSFDSQFESTIDAAVEHMERQSNYLPHTAIHLENPKSVPHGTGIYEIGEAKVVGTFENGSLKGPFKLISQEDDMVLKSVLDEDKINGLVVAYSKGCKFEMDTATRSYIFTDQFDNKAYVQTMPGDYKLIKCYDKDGRKLYTEYKNGQDHGIREVFEADGCKLTAEMKNGQLEGQSIYRDKYGDLIYKGSFQNGKAIKRWSVFSEVGVILGIFFVGTLWPRNPRRALSNLRNGSWFRSFRSRRIGSF